ncbi:MAG: sulfite exporter TauE/SafE family protein [Thermodesulfobacteriota bacterium]
MDTLRKYMRPPMLEAGVLILTLIVSYAAIFFISIGAEAPAGAMSTMQIGMVSLGFFLLSFGIAVLAVIAGIGGGVLFTPIMLAFTSVDSLIVRATGLIVAMFSGLVSTGPFMRSGLANLRVSILLAASYGVGAFGGAMGAIYVAGSLGKEGEGIIRMALGCILAALGVYFIMGGKKLEWPEVNKVDGFTRSLGLGLPFYEKSINKVVDYPMTRAGWTMLIITGVGLLSGFFGLGAGWAIVPVQNLVMAVPLKVAAANSGVLLGMGDCIAVWPYLLSGAIIPLFAAPWLAGQVLGGMMGAKLMAGIKAGFVRIILIGIMFFTSFGLLTKGATVYGMIPPVPFQVTAVVFFGLTSWVVYAVRKFNKQEANQ